MRDGESVREGNYVIAVSSTSGGGKTTLVKQTAELLSAATLFFDDYAKEVEYHQDMAAWLKDGCDPNALKSPGFVDALSSLKQNTAVVSPRNGFTIDPSDFIIIDEPMGRERDAMRPLIDFVAVIDTPPQVALARRLLRDIGYIPLEDLADLPKEKICQNYRAWVGYLQTHLNAYLQVWDAAYTTVQDKMARSCDLILDGLLKPELLANQLAEAARNAVNTS